MGNTKLANPAPLGLMGFGMTTILLNLANSGLFAFDVAILAMGIFYGGIAQIFAGLLEYKKGNTFGLTAFTSYGSFWLTLVGFHLTFFPLHILGLRGMSDLPGWRRAIQAIRSDAPDVIFCVNQTPTIVAALARRTGSGTLKTGRLASRTYRC